MCPFDVSFQASSILAKGAALSAGLFRARVFCTMVDEAFRVSALDLSI